jgi:hypothetical protein
MFFVQKRNDTITEMKKHSNMSGKEEIQVISQQRFICLGRLEIGSKHPLIIFF